MRIALLAVSLLALSGCATSEALPPEGPVGPGTKIVTSKVEPSTLVAADGTLCNVTPLKFRDTAIGDGVWCDWRRRSEGPPRGAGDGGPARPRPNGSPDRPEAFRSELSRAGSPGNVPRGRQVIAASLPGYGRQWHELDASSLQGGPYLFTLRRLPPGAAVVPLATRRGGEMEHTGEYLYTLRPTRPEMLRDGPTGAEAAVLEEHEAYLGRLAADAILILAGRTQTTDPSSFGIVVFRADSPEAAEAIMLDDPGVRGGVMRSELYPYRVAFRGP